MTMLAPTPEMIHALREEPDRHEIHPEGTARWMPTWARLLAWAIALATVVAVVVRLSTRLGTR